MRYAQPILQEVPLTGQFGRLYKWYAFKAPEIDKDFFYDKSVDLWSLGVFMYMLLAGVSPFRGTGEELIESKRAGIFYFDLHLPSRLAENLVRHLLQVKPEMRYTIEDVLNDPWMTESEEHLERFDLELAHEGFRVWEDV